MCVCVCVYVCVCVHTNTHTHILFSWVARVLSPSRTTRVQMRHAKEEEEEEAAWVSEGEDVGGIERLMCALVEAAPGPLSMSP